MDDHTYETIESEDGNFRARVVLDTESYDMKPDGDCYGTVLYQEGSAYGRQFHVWAERWKSDDDMVSVMEDLWDELGDLDDIEKVLRGEANVCEHCDAFIVLSYDAEPVYIDTTGGDVCGDEYVEGEGRYEPYGHAPRYDFSDNPIVGFNSVDLREGRLINIVTLADLKVWGWESVADFDEAMEKAYPGESVDPSRNNLDDFEAYANGDVYYVVVEQKVVLHTEVTTLEGDVIESRSSREIWQNSEAHLTCHGFYSVESATEYAQQCIDSYETRKAATA